MKWTPNQKKIIDLRNKNILVSAAAGSGKTSILVERIIKLVINEEEDIDKFLIVTFTNAAANGMKQKIQKSLLESLQKGEGKKEHLRNQINQLNKSNISTIHSFCIDVVRKNFHVIGIDPSFRIGDINEVDILMQESIDEVLEKAYVEKSEDFIKLVEGFTKNRGDSELYDIIKDAYKFILSFPDPLIWLKDSINMLTVSEDDISESLWLKAVKDYANLLLGGATEALLSAKYICDDIDGPYPYVDAIDEDIRNLNSLQSLVESNFQSFINAVHNVEFPKLKQIRGKTKEDISPDKQEKVKSLRDDYKKIIGSIKKYIPNKKLKEFAEDINYMYEPMNALYNIIADLSETFKNKKLDKAIADFNDVEHYALQILRDPEIGERYKKKFKYIFIDEYQDSNSLQEELISQIKRENNLFMVGDVKQSIYRFRLADPSIFNEKSNSYPNFEDNSLNIRIDLNQNFRSRKEILESINYIFCNIMSRKLGEVDYTEEVFLNSGAVFNEDDDKSTEIYLIDKNSKSDEEIDDEIKSLKTAELEAYFTVEKVKELLEQKTYNPIKKESRDIELKDIVILMRSVSNWAGIFEEIFSDEGIPFYYDGGAGYLETIEIQVMLNLLKIIDNIRQDIPLLSVMRSPIGNFTTEDLVKIRVLNPKYNYIDAVYDYKNKVNDSLGEKLGKFITKLEGWKKRSRYTHLSDFIWEILMETGYYYFVGVLPRGNMRQANLRLLTDKAYEFEKTSMSGLFNFLRYIEKLNISSGDMGTAKTLGENDNVVRLMSVHKSKGLEFPVVIMCGLNKRFNKTDTTKNILKHKIYGIAPKYINSTERIYKETFSRIAIKNVIKLENLSEEMRVLYVAMTRAVDKLLLIGTIDNLEAKVKKWQKGPSLYNIYSEDSYLDWICTCLFKEKTLDDVEEIIKNDNNYKIGENENFSKWKINKIDLFNIKKKDNGSINVKDQRLKEIMGFKVNKNSKMTEEINNRLNFQYFFNKSINVPTKLSVTDIKVLQEEKLDRINYKIPTLRNIPQFKEEDFTKAEIGTIVHFVMQHLLLNKGLSFEEISFQINNMVAKKMLTDKEAAIVEVEKIVHFFNTDIGKRMLHSNYVKREVPFVIKKKAKEILCSLDEKDIILIQGIIDCFFYEDGEVVIIDYKTDDISQFGVEKVKNEYKLQILYYKEAVEKITNKKVKACYLYLFDLGEAVKIIE